MFAMFVVIAVQMQTPNLQQIIKTYVAILYMSNIDNMIANQQPSFVLKNKNNINSQGGFLMTEDSNSAKDIGHRIKKYFFKFRGFNEKYLRHLANEMFNVFINVFMWAVLNF